MKTFLYGELLCPLGNLYVLSHCLLGVGTKFSRYVFLKFGHNLLRTLHFSRYMNERGRGGVSKMLRVRVCATHIDGSSGPKFSNMGLFSAKFP